MLVDDGVILVSVNQEERGTLFREVVIGTHRREEFKTLDAGDVPWEHSGGSTRQGIEVVWLGLLHEQHFLGQIGPAKPRDPAHNLVVGIRQLRGIGEGIGRRKGVH